MKRSHEVVIALSLLVLVGPLWAQTSSGNASGPAKGAPASADKSQVVCTLGNADINSGIQAGACASDAEHDGGQGGDPASDNDGPPDLVGGTSTCSNSSTASQANCFPDPNGPAHGNPPTGGGTGARAATAKQSAWLKSCAKQFATAIASCTKSPNRTLCNDNAKSSNKTCLMAASNSAQQGSNRLSPDQGKVFIKKP
jgi:hypothetical protein